MRTQSLATLTLCLLGIAAPASAQFWDPRALDGDPVAATSALAPRLTGLGPLDHPITTTRNADSQAFFAQGMNLAYGFNHPEAVRAFKEAIRLDPDNAMAWWGWAFALGPNLNLPMQAEAVAPAWRASRRALELVDRASPVERALIEALARRYSDDPKAERPPLDRAWADALADVVRQFPDHTGVATLYADALMNTSPWNYYTPDGRPRPDTPTILATLERVLAARPDHPGALHLYIHAVEAVSPDKAVIAADRLLPLMPGAGHIVHMPSHIYMQVGRYADAYQANRQAVAVDQAYLTQCRSQGIYPLLYYPHNEHFLVWAAMFEGRSAAALADARKLAAHIEHQPDVFGLPEHFDNQPLYVLARFGRWNEVLAEPAPPEQATFMRAMWHYARGLAHRHQGRLKEADRELAALRAVGTSPGTGEKYMAFAPLPALIAIADHILTGEIASARGQHDVAIARLERAVHLQDGLMYNEPPDWYFPVRHYLGAVLLDAGHAREAEVVYWQDLARNRENGYALLGLQQALAAQGREADAAAINARFRKAWQRADATLTSSRY